MQIAEERHGSVVVLIPHGDIDVTTLPQFEARLQRLVEEGMQGVLWDLSEVGVLPSTALGFLLQARHRLEVAGGRMALACASGVVKATLKTMGVLDVFPLFASREAGVTTLQARFADTP